ncbi:putative xanthine dehydrogenase subunit A [Sporomusa rhizae]|uniref:XdhC family protein n=1 Tax=Sporomusa rhizae TaxID=357999 RepID=UPI003529E596
MDEAMVKAICAVQQEGGQAALASIIATRGSTPRKAGAKMLVYRDGRVFGTIGGGCAEAEVRLQALTALDENRSFTYKVSMSGDTAANEGMACGGIMEVLIQVV